MSLKKFKVLSSILLLFFTFTLIGQTKSFKDLEEYIKEDLKSNFDQYSKKNELIKDFSNYKLFPNNPRGVSNIINETQNFFNVIEKSVGLDKSISNYILLIDTSKSCIQEKKFQHEHLFYIHSLSFVNVSHLYRKIDDIENTIKALKSSNLQLVQIYKNENNKYREQYLINLYNLYILNFNKNDKDNYKFYLKKIIATGHSEHDIVIKAKIELNKIEPFDPFIKEKNLKRIKKELKKNLNNYWHTLIEHKKPNISNEYDYYGYNEIKEIIELIQNYFKDFKENELGDKINEILDNNNIKKFPNISFLIYLNEFSFNQTDSNNAEYELRNILVRKLNAKARYILIEKHLQLFMELYESINKEKLEDYYHIPIIRIYKYLLIYDVNKDYFLDSKTSNFYSHFHIKLKEIRGIFNNKYIINKIIMDMELIKNNTNVDIHLIDEDAGLAWFNKSFTWIGVKAKKIKFLGLKYYEINFIDLVESNKGNENYKLNGNDTKIIKFEIKINKKKDNIAKNIYFIDGKLIIFYDKNFNEFSESDQVKLFGFTNFFKLIKQDIEEYKLNNYKQLDEVYKKVYK